MPPTSTATRNNRPSNNTSDNGRPLRTLLANQQAQPTPPASPAPNTITLATYNILDGRNSRLEAALRLLDNQNIDLAILTELRIPAAKPIHTRNSQGYNVFATYTTHTNQGGIALVSRAMPSNWHIESQQRHGPNILSCILATGKKRFPIIGVYLPPSHLDDLPFLVEALDRFPDPPILLGDLNVDLSPPLHNPQVNTVRYGRITNTLATYGLQDLLPHFVQRKPHRDFCTWHQHRSNQLLRSRCDYILGLDRRQFQLVAIRDPRHFSTDHFMVIGKLYVQTPKSHKHYLRGRRRFPLRAHATASQQPIDTLFAQVLANCERPKPTAPRKRPTWLSHKTLQLLDQRCQFRRNPSHCQATARRLTRAINASIKLDRKTRTEEAGAAIQAALSNTDDPHRLRNSYLILQNWYRHHGDRPPKPSRQDLDSVANEFEDLYRESTPVGPPIPIHVAPAPVDDSVPSEEEIRNAVARLRNNRATGPSKMRAEDVKNWLKLAYPEANKEGEAPPAPEPAQWLQLVDLIQTMFSTGAIPARAKWSILCLLPKPGGGTRGIGLIEIVWKLVEAIIDTRLKQVIRFHDAIHGFTKQRGTGTAIIEAKLQQELCHIRNVALYQVYLDLHKAYDKLHRKRALATFAAYGIGPRLLRLIEGYWTDQQIVPRQSGFHGRPISSASGATQGGLLSPELFNIVLDSVIHEWVHHSFPDNTSVTAGIGRAVSDKLPLFYADDGLIASTDHSWLQTSLNLLTDLFSRVGLNTNTAKTKLMTCFPSASATPMSHHAYKRRMSGEGLTYRERQRQLVTCPQPNCNTRLCASSLPRHLQSLHGIDTPSVAQPTPTPPATYRCSFPASIRKKKCPVPGCEGTATTRAGLRQHFQRRHIQDSICILEEGSTPLPRCPHCQLHLPYHSLNGRHPDTALCKNGSQRYRQYLQDQASIHASTICIQACGQDLERVEQFKYLGRMFDGYNSDWLAVWKNVQKAREKWALISRPLVRTGVEPRVVGMFYKAITQAVLLYGSETWVVTNPMLTALNSFHHRIARRISNGMPQRQGDGSWHYPPLNECLDKAGLHPVSTYIRRRQNTVAVYVLDRPIHQLCLTATPTSPRSRLRYWTQPLVTDPPNEAPAQATPPATGPTPTAPSVATALANLQPSVSTTTRYALPTNDDDNSSTSSTPSLPVVSASSGRTTSTRYRLPPDDASSDSSTDTYHTAHEHTEDITPPRYVPSTTPRAPPPRQVVVPEPAQDAFSDLTDTVASPQLHPLTRIESEFVRQHLSPQGDPDQPLNHPSAHRVIRRNFATLRPAEELSDEVIHAYLSLLIERDTAITRLTPNRRYSHSFRPFFMTQLLNVGHATRPNTYNYEAVSRYGRRCRPQDIFALNTLFIPVNVNASHWTLIVVNFRHRTIRYLDSLGSDGSDLLPHIHHYLRDEFRTTHGQSLPPNWRSIPCSGPNMPPQQRNNVDCGVFCCAYVDLLLQNVPLTLFTQQMAPTFRHRIALAILQGKATFL